jgi:GNAT superfamily N-acetyltransferase
LPIKESGAAVRIYQANSPADMNAARDLFREYGASLGFDLCFQSFDRELASLPGDYAPPSGRLLLATYDGQLAGCVALHAWHDDASDDPVCEMKRLYVRPDFRGHGIGLMLANRIIAEARAIGYKRMRLDTVPSIMAKAVTMYRQFGFVEIAPYRENPVAGAIYLEKVL